MVLFTLSEIYTLWKDEDFLLEYTDRHPWCYFVLQCEDSVPGWLEVPVHGVCPGIQVAELQANVGITGASEVSRAKTPGLDHLHLDEANILRLMECFVQTLLVFTDLTLTPVRPYSHKYV